jgi:nucleoside-diphosphate-sugar epimerase
MRVLLTGATGFVGSHVARVLLDAGCDVVALVRPGATRSRILDIQDRLMVIDGDLESFVEGGMASRVAPTLCVHLAWHAEPGRYLRDIPANLASVYASVKLARALGDCGCRRLVCVGTCAEYGIPLPGEPLDERAPVDPRTPYARAKAAYSMLAQDLATQAGMEFAWARLFFLYGPWEEPQRVVPAAILACLQDKHFPATAGAQVRDYLHVADAANGLSAVALSHLVGRVNVCSGQGVTLREVLQLVEKATGRQGLIGFGEVPYGPEEWMWMRGSNAALTALGWRPSFTLDSGIADTAGWWRDKAMPQ